MLKLNFLDTILFFYWASSFDWLCFFLFDFFQNLCLIFFLCQDFKQMFEFIKVNFVVTVIIKLMNEVFDLILISVFQTKIRQCFIDLIKI